MTTTHGVSARLYEHHPALGRHQVLDARSLSYRHPGTNVRAGTVHWQPKIPVLDQQHLFQQGIRTSLLAPTPEDVDALGSCTANAATAALSVLLTEDQCAAAGLDITDAVAAQEWAISLYSEATRQDEWLARQWPEDDCGSSGLGVARAVHARGLIGSYHHATNSLGLLDMLRGGPALIGMPWYNAFFEPPTNGNLADLPDWRRSGIAGGHEVCVIGIEQIAWTDRLPNRGPTPVLPDLDRTVLRVRNSWGASWGLDGDFLLPLSIYAELRREIDAIAFRPVTA